MTVKLRCAKSFLSKVMQSQSEGCMGFLKMPEDMGDLSGLDMDVDEEAATATQGQGQRVGCQSPGTSRSRAPLPPNGDGFDMTPLLGQSITLRHRAGVDSLDPSDLYYMMVVFFLMGHPQVFFVSLSFISTALLLFFFLRHAHARSSSTWATHDRATRINSSSSLGRRTPWQSNVGLFSLFSLHHALSF